MSTLLILLLVLPGISVAKPVYTWTSGYIDDEVRDAMLQCDFGSVVLEFRGEVSGSRVVFRDVPVVYSGERCRVVVNGFTVGWVALNGSGVQRFSFSKAVGESVIYGRVVAPGGEPADAVVVAVRERGGGGFLGALLKLFLLPIGVASAVMGLALDIIVGGVAGVVAPWSIGKYGFPMFRIFSVPLGAAVGSEPIRISGDVVLAVSSGERGVVFEGGRWKLKALPAVMLVSPSRVLELGSGKAGKRSEKYVLLFLGDLVERRVLFRNFAPGYSESGQVSVDARGRGVVSATLTLRKSFRVSGRVLLRSGGRLVPVENAVVGVAQGAGGGYGYTGKDGYFEVSTNIGEGVVKVFLLYVPGRAVFKIGKNGWAPLYVREFRLPEQLGEAGNVTFVVEPVDAVRITGRVVFGGRPVRGALVYVTPRGSNVIVPGSGAVTGGDGRFSLNLYSVGGEYRVVVEYPVDSVSGWKVFSVDSGRVDVGDVEVYGWLKGYSIVKVDVGFPRGMVRAYVTPYLVDSKGGVYVAGVPVPAGRYRVRVDPVSAGKVRFTGAFEREVEVGPGEIVEIRADLGWAEGIPRVDVVGEVRLRRRVFLVLSVNGDGFSDNVSVALTPVSVGLLRGVSKVEVYRDGVKVFSKASSEGGVKGVVGTREPGVYEVRGVFEPEGSGKKVGVSYEYIRWGGKPRVQVSVLKGSAEVDEVYKDDTVDVKVSILDRRLAVAPKEVLGRVRARIRAVNPEGKVVFERVFYLYQAKRVAEGRELHARIRLDREGRWVVSVEVAGSPYIEEVGYEKSIVVKQNLGWLAGLLLVVSIVAALVVIYRRVRGRGSRRRLARRYYGELEW